MKEDFVDEEACIAYCVGLLASSKGISKNKCIIVSHDKIRAVIDNRLADSSNGGAEVGEKCKKIIDFGPQSLAIPAIIDLHVHLRGLKQKYKETAYTGTMAAASSGISIVVDMPNTIPPLRDPFSLEEKLEELRDNAIIDYGVYAGVPNDIRDAEAMISKGIVGFKIYPEDFERDTRLCDLFKKVSASNLLIIVHPEEPDIISIERGWNRHVERGCHVELAAIIHTAKIAENCGNPRIHITHVSCPTSIDKVLKLGFTLDVTPHHVLLDTEYTMPISDSCIMKVNPPLRSTIQRIKLQNEILKQIIKNKVVFSSDHAPHSYDEKRLHPLLCPPGIASLEQWPRILLHYFISSKMGINLYVHATARGPAHILGLNSRGDIEEGKIADIAIYDLRHYSRILTQNYSKSKYTPYFMWPALDTLALVVRGTIVYDYNKGFLVKRGFGKNIASPRQH